MNFHIPSPPPPLSFFSPFSYEIGPNDLNEINHLPHSLGLWSRPTSKHNTTKTPIPKSPIS